MNLREWALPVYTILLQLATGTLLALWILRTAGGHMVGTAEMDRLVKRPCIAVWFTLVVAMFGAHFHLSRPLLSFLAILNLRTSWLSREILFTALFFVLMSGLLILQWFVKAHSRLQTILGWLAIVSGAASIYCMSAIYLLPTQPAWNSVGTTISFYSTAVMLGSVATGAILILDLKFSELRGTEDVSLRAQAIRTALLWFTIIASLATAILVVINLEQITTLAQGNQLAQTSLELLLELYRPLFVVRFGLLLFGVGWLVFTVWRMSPTPARISELMTPVYMACLLVLVSEILGRFLFYATHVRLGI